MNIFHSILNRSRRKSKAQAIVEFALVLPVLLLVLVGILEVSRLLFAWIVIENSTRFGIRYATTGNFEPPYCQSMFGTDCNTDDKVDAARIPSIKDETESIVIGFFLRNLRTESVTTADERYFNVTVCSGKGGRTWIPPVNNKPVYAECLLNGVTNEDPGGPGERVVVAADYNFTFIVLPAFGIEPDMIHLASYREGIVENFRATRAINTPLPLNIPTVATNTPVPTETYTPTMTATASNTPTATSTFTPTPIPDCSDLSFSGAVLQYNNVDDARFRVTVNNSGPTTFTLNRGVVYWVKYPGNNHRTDYLSFAGGQFWNGSGSEDLESPTDSTNNAGDPGETSSYFSVAPNSSATFLAVYRNVPSNLASLWYLSDFTGTTLYFTEGGCSMTFNGGPTQTPTFTPTVTNTPTRTNTPTITNTPTVTRTPTITRTPSRTPTITATVPSPTRTATVPSPTRTRTPTRTATVPSPTRTNTGTPTATVPTPTRTNTRTPTPTVLSPTPTNTRTPTSTPPATPTPTICFDC